MGQVDLSHPGWERAIAAIASSPGVVVVLGAPDVGKTTWLAAAVQRLGRAGVLPLAIVDSDVGQASIGPPATAALCLLREPPGPEFVLGSLQAGALSFVGSVSPVGYLLQMLVACKRLVDWALQDGAKTVLVDTTGLVGPGVGFQLKLRKIELVEPTHLIALQRQAELEPLLSVVSGREGLRVHRLQVSPSADRRTPAERAAYRANRFAAYFAGACSLALSTNQVLLLAPPTGRSLPETRGLDLMRADVLRAERHAGLLMGLNNGANETLGLGLLESVSKDGREVHVWTPLRDASAVCILQLGSLRLDQSGQELSALLQ